MRLVVFSTPSFRLWLALTPGLLAFAGALLWLLYPSQSAVNLPLTQSLSEVHMGVWVSLFVGLAAYLTSSWVWALKPASLPTQLFALSGVMTLLFTFAAAFSLMPTPLPEPYKAIRPIINTLGASGFGMVMMCLFLIYPSRLKYWRIGFVITIVLFGLWTILSTFGPYKNYDNVQPITFVEMIGIILIGLWQIWVVRHDPIQRAISIWLGASVLLGAGAFIVLISIPLTFGFKPWLLPHYAFGSFFLIYAGLAVGLLRYRLFELGGWAFHLIFHVCLALVLVALDAILIGSLSMTPGVVFSLSVFAMVFLYLPLRDHAWQKLTQSQEPDESEIFRAVIEVAFKPSGEKRAQSWEALLKSLYRPLELVSAETDIASPRLMAEGLELHMPAIAHAPSLVLRYPHAGRSLFSPRDLALAGQIEALMRYAEESRSAYDRGVVEERTRIARDIHDSIGAQLLQALHSGPIERKDAMIRDTLSDLRGVINNAQNQDLPLSVVISDLRAETADRLSPHDMSLDWRAEFDQDLLVLPTRVHALRSLIREASSNSIKHAKATQLKVQINMTNDLIDLVIEDNGRGFSQDKVVLGNGLHNMKARAEGLSGQFSITQATPGTRIRVAFPTQPTEDRS